MSRGQQVALHGKDNRIGGIDPIPPGRWEYPSVATPLLNDWVNAGGGLQEFRWRRTNENQTEVQGFVVAGTDPVVINLPDPYRPASTQTCVGTDALGGVVVWTFEPSGDLSVETVAGGAPSGAAGGALDGTYPNPGIAASVAGAGLAESANVLSVNVDNSTVEISSDSVRVKASGITANEIAADAVGSSEIATDAVGSAEIAAGAVTETEQALADVTTHDVSTTKHGYAPKAPNDATRYLDGTGAWSVPAGGSSWSVLTDGDTSVPELVFAGGDVIMVES